jgi:hypothetical protein
MLVPRTGNNCYQVEKPALCNTRKGSSEREKPDKGSCLIGEDRLGTEAGDISSPDHPLNGDNMLLTPVRRRTGAHTHPLFGTRWRLG